MEAIERERELVASNTPEWHKRRIRHNKLNGLYLSRFYVIVRVLIRDILFVGENLAN